MKFKPKYQELEAEQYLPDFFPKGLKFDSDNKPYVITTHGQKTPVELYDWICTEPDGNGYYPCKPHIFEKRWEPV